MGESSKMKTREGEKETKGKVRELVA